MPIQPYFCPPPQGLDRSEPKSNWPMGVIEGVGYVCRPLTSPLTLTGRSPITGPRGPKSQKSCKSADFHPTWKVGPEVTWVNSEVWKPYRGGGYSVFRICLVCTNWSLLPQVMGPSPFGPSAVLGTSGLKCAEKWAGRKNTPRTHITEGT